jgi:hypothetical protein
MLNGRDMGNEGNYIGSILPCQPHFPEVRYVVIW